MGLLLLGKNDWGSHEMCHFMHTLNFTMTLCCIKRQVKLCQICVLLKPLFRKCGFYGHFMGPIIPSRRFGGTLVEQFVYF